MRKFWCSIAVDEQTEVCADSAKGAAEKFAEDCNQPWGRRGEWEDMRTVFVKDSPDGPSTVFLVSAIRTYRYEAKKM